MTLKYNTIVSYNFLTTLLEENISNKYFIYFYLPPNFRASIMNKTCKSTTAIEKLNLPTQSAESHSNQGI